MTPPPAAPASAIPSGTSDAADAQRHHNEGHGRRLTAAFEALEAFPALAESRDRLLRLVTADRISPGDVVAAVESDVALVISVLRLANQVEGPSRGRVESVVEAVELLSPEAVQGLAARARTFDFFERSSVWDAAPERFRLHGVATQRAADRLAAAAGYAHRDRLLVTALLHDVGKLVLMHAYPGYPRQVHGPARTPEERLHYERRELGVDHALVGGALDGDGVQAEALRGGVPGLAALEELECLGVGRQALDGLGRQDLDRVDDRLDLTALGRVETVGEPEDGDHERDVGLDGAHHVAGRRALLGHQREQAVARLGERREHLQRLEGGRQALAVALVAGPADDGVGLARASLGRRLRSARGCGSGRRHQGVVGCHGRMFRRLVA